MDGGSGTEILGESAAGETGVIPMNRDGKKGRNRRYMSRHKTGPVILEIGGWNVSSR